MDERTLRGARVKFRGESHEGERKGGASDEGGSSAGVLPCGPALAPSIAVQCEYYNREVHAQRGREKRGRGEGGREREELKERRGEV